MACQSENFDFAALPILDEGILLEGLRQRYNEDYIYAYVGDILVAVNPFQPLDLYGAEYTKRYQLVKSRWSIAPHIFAVADAAYQNLCNYHDNQCCIISGESGAGKTESAKHIVHHVISLCHCSNNLQHQILQVNPLLEAFGNARTVMNNNSSRFGKFLELQFDANLIVTGAKITEYLLEKSRVVTQAPGESNFHIFYYLVAGLDEAKRKSLQLHDKHRFIASKHYDKDEHVLTQLEYKTSFDVVCQCFDVVDFSTEEVETIFLILAAVLHIGDIQFVVKKGREEAVISNKPVVSIVVKLLDLEPVEFEQSLITTLTSMRGETICRLHTLTQAEDARDATAKALYGRLFAWIVYKINQTLCNRIKQKRARYSIAILDIFGFENFKQNSFEQLCINVANEQLQFYFNQHIFAWEKEQYIGEGITIKDDISYVNNKPLCDLFLKKPIGLLTLLDEESKFPRATDSSLVMKFNRHFSKNDYFLSSRDARAISFAIRHYAGKVVYNADGFLEKNRDSLSDNLKDCFKASGCELLSEMFINKLTRTGSMTKRATQILNMDQAKSRASLLTDKKPVDIKSATLFTRRPVKEDISVRRQQSMERRKGSITISAKDTLSRPTTKGPLTLANHFRNSLADLMEKMLSSTPHFVRCIKPNKRQVARDFDADFVMKQLRYTGIMEAVRIRRHGYPTRLSFVDFVDRYKWIVYGFGEQVEANKKTCLVILKASGLSGWQVGKSKVFLKCQQAETLVTIINKKLHKIAIVQKMVRRWLAVKGVARLKQEAISQSVALETMMKSILMGSCYDQQHQLSQDDQDTSDNQCHLVAEVMGKVMTSSAELCDMIQKLVDEDKTLQVAEKNYIGAFLCEVSEVSEHLKLQQYKLSEDDSKYILMGQSQITKFLSSLVVASCEEQLYRLQTEDLQMMEQDTIQVSTFLSTVLPNIMSCCQWQQLLYQQDEVNSDREQDLVTWLMMQVTQTSIDYGEHLLILNDEDVMRQKMMQHKSDMYTTPHREEHNVDHTLFQTLRQHLLNSTHYTTPSGHPRPWCSVVCFEDGTCLGEMQLVAPVMVIDGSSDQTSVTRIGLGSFPTNSQSVDYVKCRDHIGLGVMVNRDSSGTLWMTSLVEDDVVTVTIGSTTTSLDKGLPTKVFLISKLQPHLADIQQCIITINFKGIHHVTCPYHVMMYVNEAIDTVTVLQVSRDHLLSVTNSDIQSLDIVTNSSVAQDMTDFPPVSVIGWRVVI
ncbi:myosin-IIIa-like isoform X2 [Dysidea avara]|uniref:myosin-IIIa-like isoform X2 n=1 Tax=Dysidea avara TaxID=196820 RepID=UPI0033251509